MRTVKEVSEQTGISVRTLHYYDEIGLLKPTKCSEAGYRLYDDKALEVLQQILFFREFDMPLKDIKLILSHPDFDREQILKSQQKMLELKKERLERLIASIDDILKGVNHMDFTVFSREDLEQIYQAHASKLSDAQKEIIKKEYGGMDRYREHFIKNAGNERVQKNFQKVVEWYGDKDSAMDAAVSPKDPQVTAAYQKRMEDIQRRLAAKLGCDVSSFEVKEIIGEYDFVAKQIYQMKNVKALMLDMAAAYREDEKMQKAVDAVYGEGTSRYMGEALEEFYRS